MANIEVIYTGNLHTTATHLLSGNSIVTDAPPDNQGKGEAFSPTDLLATAFATCILTVMGLAARTHNFNIDNAKCKVTKIMSANPRRVAEIKVDIDFPKNNYSEKEKNILHHCIKNCPVALSLHPEVKQTVNLNF